MPFLFDQGRLTRSLQCAGCEADLNSADKECPECATPVADTIRFRLDEAGIDHHGWVTSDRACAQCGYSLRGTHFDAACPECNHPVRQSVYAGLISYAPPAWIELLQKGATYVSTGIAALWATLLLSLTGFMPGLGEGCFTIGLLLGFLLAVGLPLLGGWMLTTPPPGPLDSPLDRRQRVVIRLAIVLAAAAPVGLMLSNFALARPQRWVFSLGAATAGLAGLVGLLTYLNHIERFTAKWFSPDIAAPIARLRRIAWVWLAAFFCLLAMQGVLMPRWPDVARLLGFSAAGAFVLYTGSAWMLHVRVIGALAKPLISAHKHWPAPTMIGPPPDQST